MHRRFEVLSRRQVIVYFTKHEFKKRLVHPELIIVRIILLFPMTVHKASLCKLHLLDQALYSIASSALHQPSKQTPCNALECA